MMFRYQVGFYASYVFLSYITIWADSEAEAEKEARSKLSYRGWDNADKYDVRIQKV